MLFDDRQLAGQSTIDERWRDAVEPGEQSFGKAEMMLAVTAAQGTDDLPGDFFGAVAVVLQRMVQRLDGIAVEWRVDGAGRKMDDRHQRIGQFPTQSLGKPAQPGLGRRVGGETGKWQATEGRPDVDDRRLRLRLEPRQQCLGEMDRRLEIGRQNLLDGRPILMLEEAKSADTGVVDQHVDVELACRTGKRRNAVRPAEVSADAGRTWPQRCDQGTKATAVAPGKQQRGTGVGQLLGEFLAESAAGARQQNACIF